MSVSIIERKPVLRNLNLPFGLLILGMLAGLLLAAQLDVDPRRLGAITGAIALGGVLYRGVSTWSETPTLVHVLWICVAVFLLFGAIGQYQLADKAPLTIVSWPSLALRCAIIIVVIHWPRWVDRHRSPFVR